MAKKKGRAKGKAARNARSNQSGDNRDEHLSKNPHSFVFHRGHVGKTVKELALDVRKIMEPFTATKLKVRRKNVMKDFLTIAGPMHVSHFIVFTKTDIATYMRLICVPRGPTLTFKINEFTLAKDVLSYQKHPDVESKLFNNHAVMVTNIPSDTMENKLMNVSFKNMFPSINPNSVKLNNMRRCVLVNYDKDTKSVELRHYTMKVVPTGISKAMKKLMKPNLPDMSKHEDIADVFLDKGMSDSEGEQDGAHSQVTVSQKIKDRGVARNATNAIRLKEVGPRLSLQLIKIEEGFEGGNILFHSLVQKTPEEVEALKLIKMNKRKEKLARKQRQEANVRKKEEDKEMQVKKTIEGMEKKKLESGEAEDDEVEEVEAPKPKGDSDSDDDYAHYKKEVGQEPEPEMFTNTRKRKRDSSANAGGSQAKRWQNGKTFDSKKKFAGRDDRKKESKFSVKFKGGDDRKGGQGKFKGGDDRKGGQGKFKGGDDRKGGQGKFKGGDDRKGGQGKFKKPSFKGPNKRKR